MAMSKLQLRPMTGVTRPAIAAFFPTVGELVCMLDLGANIECDAENLVQFAILGQAFHRSLTGKESPRLGLLNVGEEEQKGMITFAWPHAACQTRNLAELSRVCRRLRHHKRPAGRCRHRRVFR